MNTEKQRWFAAAGGLLAAAYLALNNLLPSPPEFLLGLLLGLRAALMLTGLLPAEAWRKLRKRKRRGE